MAEPRVAGAIYDLGYQHYEGEILGRGAVFRTLVRFSLRTAFGIGRGDKAKSLPALVFVVVYMPALIQVGIASATGMTAAISYANHLEFTALLLALFAAAQAPELIVTDRQQGMLALYLSRPLRAVDYALAKLVALTAAMLVLTLGPQLVLFLGKIFVGEAPWTAFVAEWTKLFPIVGGTLLVSLFFASIGLGLSSFASRRGFATAGVIAFFLLTAAFAGMLRAVAFGAIQRYAILLNPVLLITGFANWLFALEAARHSEVGRADLPGQLYLYVMLAASAAGIALLLRRFHQGEP